MDFEEFKEIVLEIRARGRKYRERYKDYVDDDGEIDAIDDTWILSELALVNLKSQEDLNKYTKILLFVTIILVVLTMVLLYYTAKIV